MAELLQALKDGPAYEFSCNKKPKCPHCGEDFDISECEAWELYDDDDSHEVECPECNLSFIVETHKTYSFSTDNQDSP